MKRDFHFDVVRLLCAWAGLDSEQSTLIAWASEKTDRVVEPPRGAIQTQVAPKLLGANWDDRQVQLTVMVAFHFIPGDGEPWIVTANSTRAQKLVEAALGDPVRLGIALHTLADTWSHQNFSGFIDNRNSCYAWSNLVGGLLPDLGHIDMMEQPDMIEAEWTDPRTGEKIVNRERFSEAARVIFNWLLEQGRDWQGFQGVMNDILRMKKYDQRRERLFAEWLDFGNIGSMYNLTDQELAPRYMPDFMRAAKEHMSLAVNLCKDLPPIEK